MCEHNHSQRFTSQKHECLSNLSYPNILKYIIKVHYNNIDFNFQFECLLSSQIKLLPV